MGLLEEYGFERFACEEDVSINNSLYKDKPRDLGSFEIKSIRTGLHISQSNSLKSLNGNNLNKRVHNALEDLLLEGLLRTNQKEQGFQGLAGFAEEKIILDSYVETTKEYHFSDGVRPFRIGIDNTTVLRKDRFRGKQYEALMLKEDNLVDYFIVITLNESDITGSYLNDNYEVLGIKRLQDKILTKAVNTVVDNVLNYSQAIGFIRDLCNFEESKKKKLADYIRELELKYKF